MPLNPIQQAVYDGMQKEGSLHFYAGHVCKRDGRIVPLADPSERHREAKDPTALCFETEDNPPDRVDVIEVAPAVAEVKVAGKVTVEAKAAETREERTKLPNDSALEEVPTTKEAV